MLFEESNCVCIPSFRPVTPFIFLENHSWLSLNTERSMAIWTCLRCSPGDTDFKYIWVCGSDFNCSSVNQGYTDRHIDTQTNI